MDYSREKTIAIQAVAEATQLCLHIQRDLVETASLEKHDRSPVTIADFGSQALICRRLVKTFPHDAIVGEEDSIDLRRPEAAQHLRLVTEYVQRFHADANNEAVCQWIDKGRRDIADRFWTVDPIDGTKGFLRNEQYAIALALIENGEVKVGVLGCPVLPRHLAHPHSAVGVTFVAVKGEGATMVSLSQDTSISIHVVAQNSGQCLRFVQSVESGHGNSALQSAIAKTVGITQPPLLLDSQVKYGAVARGDAGLYLRFPSERSPNYREKIWDHAAGTLIVEEAGGQVTDMLGRPLDFGSDYRMVSNRGVIASNGTIHNAVLKALERAAAEDTTTPEKKEELI
jgi:3'(2'), 5'-bisphosphate nucleotidase